MHSILHRVNNAPIGIIGAQLRALLEPLCTMMLEEFQGFLIGFPLCREARASWTANVKFSVGPLRLSNLSLTVDPKIMSETFANEFSSVYFTGNLNSLAPHQAFCCNLE